MRFEEVTVDYGDGRGVFDLNFAIQKGECVSFVGPSGAGKSTTIALMNGLVLPDSGTVSVLGVDTRELVRRSGASYRHRIGTIHQSLNLTGALRVIHNVSAGRLGRWSTPRALLSLLSPRDIEEVRLALERVGVGDLLWERTDKLSGGQQQRVAIARVLLQDPDLVLADEPVSSLDPARSRSVIKLLVDTVGHTAERPDRALVMSLHDPDLARSFSRRVVGMTEGMVQFDLPPSSVSDDMLDELYSLESLPGSPAEP